MPDENPHLGSTLESLLREDGTYENAKNDAVKSVLACKLEQTMKDQSLSEARMAERMETSRSQLDRLLDPENDIEETTVQPLDEGLRLRGGQRPPPRSPRPATNPVGQKPANGGPSAQEVTPPGPTET